MGEAQFLLALRGDDLLGSVTGVLRPVWHGTRKVDALYICDLKLAKHARGSGLSTKLLLQGLRAPLPHPPAAPDSFPLRRGDARRPGRRDAHRPGLEPAADGAGIQRADSRSTSYRPHGWRRWIPGVRPRVPWERGSAWGPRPPGRWKGRGGAPRRGTRTFSGCPAGRPGRWFISAAPPETWAHGWGEYLRTCGVELAALGGEALACFSIDERLEDHVHWLREVGIAPDSVCTVYSLDLSFPVRAPAWVHLPSSEI